MCSVCVSCACVYLIASAIREVKIEHNNNLPNFNIT